jgi:hypothetical protein
MAGSLRIAAGLAGVEAAGVDLADVSDEVGLVVRGGREERSEPTQQLLVGDGLQFIEALHTRTVSTSACRPRSARASFVPASREWRRREAHSHGASDGALATRQRRKDSEEGITRPKMTRRGKAAAATGKNRSRRGIETGRFC